MRCRAREERPPLADLSSHTRHNECFESYAAQVASPQPSLTKSGLGSDDAAIAVRPSLFSTMA